LNVIYLCVLGAVLSLDTVAVFQVLISQPIVACTLIGYLSNDPMTGIQIGILMQLFWISTLPVGAVTFPDGNLGAIVATIIAVENVQLFPEYESLIILFSVVFGLFVSFLGAHALNTVRMGNVYILNQLLNKIDASKLDYVGKTISWSILFNFCVLFVIIFICSIVGSSLIEAAYSFAPSEWIKYTKYSRIALLGSGAGLTFTLFKEKKSKLLITGLILFSITVLIIF